MQRSALCGPYHILEQTNNHHHSFCQQTAQPQTLTAAENALSIGKINLAPVVVGAVCHCFGTGRGLAE